jgi:hypothetical protein
MTIFQHNETPAKQLALSNGLPQMTLQVTRYVSRCTLVAVTALLIGPQLALNYAQAASAAPFVCQVRPAGAEAPPPLPSISPHGTVIPKTQLAAPCPPDEVPYPVSNGGIGLKMLPPIPTGSAAGTVSLSASLGGRSVRRSHPARYRAGLTPRSPRHTRRSVRMARSHTSQGWYSWALAYRRPPGGHVSEVWDEQTNQQPYIRASGSHSLGQLWADDEYASGQYSTVEEGWTEAPGQYPDVQPHLFVAMSDCNYYREGGYIGLSGIPWVQNSSTAYPNMVVTHDDHEHFYVAKLQGNNWWFYYDGQWLGYIPHSAWTCHFPSPNVINWGGEVETPEEITCTDMGNGLAGTQQNSATVGYTYWVNNLYAQPGYFEAAYFSDIAQYNAGLWYPSKEPYSLHYGGPGWC